MIVVSPYSIPNCAIEFLFAREALRQRWPFNIVRHGKRTMWRVPWIARRRSSPTRLAGAFSAKRNEAAVMDADRSSAKLPSETPRPAGEREELQRIWARPSGWRMFTAVNNTDIGLFYMGAAFLFFLLAGVLALLMRTQLARGDNSFIGQNLYNQIFTVHGTTMMFLFTVPAIEALGVILLPQMLAARDLPFPRLSAFAIWAYVIGGLVFFLTIFVDLAPNGGWFMYPPLTLTEFTRRQRRILAAQSASSKFPRSPAQLRLSWEHCARAPPACRLIKCRSSHGRC